MTEARLRKEVRVAEQQFGFMPGRSTTDAIFSLRMLLEKWKEGKCTVQDGYVRGRFQMYCAIESCRQG